MLQARFHFIVIVSIIFILQTRKQSQGEIMQLIQHCRANKVLEPDLTENVLFTLPSKICSNRIVLLSVPRTHLLSLAMRSSHNCSLCMECPSHKFYFCLDHIYSFVKSLLKCHLFREVFPYYLKLFVYFFMVCLSPIKCQNCSPLVFSSWNGIHQRFNKHLLYEGMHE